MPFINSVRGTYSSLTGRAGGAGKNLANITGGDSVTTPGNGYKYHYFTTAGSNPFDATSVGAPFLVDYLVVAGGGGGGGELSDQYNGGGGGAGGYLSGSSYSIAAGVYTVAVGNGGRTTSKPGAIPGEDGSPSFFHVITATGGGGGGADPITGYPAGNPGGSGGGGGSYSGSGAGGNGVPGQGYPGGTGGPALSYPSGGGGGASGRGYNGNESGPNPNPGGSGGPFFGNGGNGLTWPGNSTTYAGGGGGGGGDSNANAPSSQPGPSQPWTQGNGGLGGGQNGGDGYYGGYPIGWIPGYSTQRIPLDNANAYYKNTGGGGGGHGRIPSGLGEGSPGGPGIVVIRYNLSQ